MDHLLGILAIVLLFGIAGACAENQSNETRRGGAPGTMSTGSEVTARPVGSAIASPSRTSLTPSPEGEEAMFMGTGDGSAGSWSPP